MSWNPLIWLQDGGAFGWLAAVFTLVACGWAVVRTRRRSVYRWADVAAAWMLFLYTLGLAGGQGGIIMTFAAAGKASGSTQRQLLERGLWVSTYPARVAILGMVLFVGVLVLVQVVARDPEPDRLGFGWVAIGALSHAVVAGAITAAALPFWGFLATQQPIEAVEAMYSGAGASLLALLWPPTYGVGRVIAGFVARRRRTGEEVS